MSTNSSQVGVALFPYNIFFYHNEKNIHILFFLFQLDLLQFVPGVIDMLWHVSVAGNSSHLRVSCKFLLQRFTVVLCSLLTWSELQCEKLSY